MGSMYLLVYKDIKFDAFIYDVIYLNYWLCLCKYVGCLGCVLQIRCTINISNTFNVFLEASMFLQVQPMHS